MPKHWKTRPYDIDQSRFLEKEAKIPAVLAQLLCARGITNPEQVRDFLDPQLSSLPSPQSLPGCSEVVQRLLDALQNNRKITVYGDYDVDGMTGTAILVKSLRFLANDAENVNYYIPSRLEEGYGLSDDALKKLAEAGTQLVVSVDCGITACEQAKTAKSLGIELLITDHHTPGLELPNVNAIAHPQLVRWQGKLRSPNDPEIVPILQSSPQSTLESTESSDSADRLEKYPFTGISGAMVAFKVADLLGAVFFEKSKGTPRHQNYYQYLREAMGLATMGTIADVVPLLNENRTFVRCCLEKSFAENLCLGLRKLADVAKINRDKPFTAETIGFQLAPRLNAAGRMGDAMLGVELLLTNDPARASELAEKINELNKKRQEQEREIQEQAEEQIQTLYSKNDAAFVLDSNNSKEDHLFWQHWHPGIIGIVAGRLSEKYCRPVVVLTYNERNKSQATGSARGISEFDLYEAFETCKKHLESFGGHIAAAGLTIEKGNIPMFREAFVEYCKEKIDDKLQQSMQTLWLDGEYPFSAFSFNTVQQIEKLAPFGCENRRPFFSSTNVYLESPAKRMGADGQHFSATFLQDGIAFRGIAFGRGDWVDKMNEIFEKSAMSLFNIAFHVVLNTFAGRTKVELQIVDWNPAEK